MEEQKEQGRGADKVLHWTLCSLLWCVQQMHMQHGATRAGGGNTKPARVDARFVAMRFDYELQVGQVAS